MASNENQDGAKPDGSGQSPSKKASQALSTFTETFGLSRAAAIGVVLFVSFVIIAAICWFILSAPPRTLIITTGPPGSSFQRFAEQYRDFLSNNGVTLKILPSEGSLENLQRLGNPAFHADIGFVLAGETNDRDGEKLYSLGSVAYQPLLIFYRGTAPLPLLSDLAGKRLAIGPAGSGAHVIALALLSANGIVPGGTTALLDLDAETAATNLLDGKLDAVFVMGDSASPQTMRTLLRSPGIQMFDFTQADAYTRRLTYLNKLELSRGVIDFGQDLPPHDVNLVGPTVELITRAGLHPALSDLLLEAARKVHGKANIFQHRAEFPAALEHEFQISPDAGRFYNSGKKLLYRSLPFWLASLLNRVLVAFVPILLLLIPGLKLIPTAYKWRVQLRIYRWYRRLLKLEHELVGGLTAAQREELRRRLDHIETSVGQMKVPASFAGQFYGLREHIGIVRDRIGGG